MADKTLEIESGQKEIELKNKTTGDAVTVVIPVYDVFFIHGILDAAERLDALRKQLADAAGENMTAEQFRAFYEKTKEIDPKMREIVDQLFAAPVCNTLFPRQSMFAVGSGAQTWENLLLAIIDEMDDGISVEKEAAKTRIRKYSAKYKK